MPRRSLGVVATVLGLVLVGCTRREPEPPRTPSPEVARPLTTAQDVLELPLDLYTMSFAGCDAIWVVETHPEQRRTPAREAVISDPASVTRIVDTLTRLPRRGPIMKRLAPSVIIRLACTARGNARGYVELYGARLKTESTGFLAAGDVESARLEGELYEHVTRALATPPAR